MIFEGVIEAIMSMDSSLQEMVPEKTALFEWILARLKVKGFDTNSLYASEILAICLQGSAKNRYD